MRWRGAEDPRHSAAARRPTRMARGGRIARARPRSGRRSGRGRGFASSRVPRAPLRCPRGTPAPPPNPGGRASSTNSSSCSVVTEISSGSRSRARSAAGAGWASRAMAPCETTCWKAIATRITTSSASSLSSTHRCTRSMSASSPSVSRGVAVRSRWRARSDKMCARARRSAPMPKRAVRRTTPRCLRSFRVSGRTYAFDPVPAPPAITWDQERGRPMASPRWKNTRSLKMTRPDTAAASGSAAGRGRPARR